MNLERVTQYLLKHRLQAVLITLGITLIPVVDMLAILYAALVTLRKGVAEGAVMTLAATLPFIVRFMLISYQPDILPVVLWVGISFFVVSNALTWALAVLLHRQMTWSGILQLTALFGVLMICALHLVYPDVADWWSTQLTHAAMQAAKNMPSMMTDGATTLTLSDAQLQSIRVIKDCASGLVVGLILMFAVLQLIIARWWQSTLFSKGMLRKELHQIRLSSLAGFLFSLALVFSWMGNSVVLDIMPILYLLFAGAGLSVVHYFFGLMVSPTRWFWIVLFYITLIFTMTFSVTLIAMVALLDVWLDLRRKLRKI